MKLYRLHKKQLLPITLNEAWDFFSNPHNLKRITPPWLNFTVRTDGQQEMYAGMIIEHRVSPVLRIPTTWITEITHVRAPHYFVDEQRFGPYKFWHHQHRFNEIEGGVEIEDLVHYGLPFGFLGRIVHRMMISGMLEQIFAHRQVILEEKFGTHKGQRPAPHKSQSATNHA